MGRKKKSEAVEFDVPQDKVRRELTHDEIDERRVQLANLSIEVLDLEEERKSSNQDINVRLKDAKKTVRQLAQEIRSGEEWVPAQMELADARESRRKAVRGVQDSGAAVEP